MYLRVSTASKSGHGDARAYDQNPEVQEQPLRELIAQRGWQLEKVYSDRASGAQEHRPGLSSLMADARRGGFDVVVVWRFDRFARSVKQTRAGVGRVSGAGYRLRIAPGGSGHFDSDGQGDVHNHCGHGRARAQYHPRAGNSRDGSRAAKWDALREGDWPAESDISRGSGSRASPKWPFLASEGKATRRQRNHRTTSVQKVADSRRAATGELQC